MYLLWSGSWFSASCGHHGVAPSCDHVQVLTACLKSFAHGANDTANAAGPFAAVQSLYLNSTAGCEGIVTPLWVLAFCGVGIVVVSMISHANDTKHGCMTAASGCFHVSDVLSDQLS